ncbi:WD40-repeat-containing domain protein, partial [Rhizoctonia solani]
SGETVLGPLKGHTERVNSIQFSSDGRYIISGASDTAICMWDAQTGQPILGLVKWHTAPVLSVRFSPDSVQVVSGSEDKTIRVTNIRSKVGSLLDSLPPTCNEWTMNEYGWIIDEQDRLFAWVPPELRTASMWPRTELLISKKGYIRLGLSEARLEDSCTDCY